LDLLLSLLDRYHAPVGGAKKLTSPENGQRKEKNFDLNHRAGL
jgi:hypothetical protein